jgi:hypothetical protein
MHEVAWKLVNTMQEIRKKYLRRTLARAVLIGVAYTGTVSHIQDTLINYRESNTCSRSNGCSDKKLAMTRFRCQIIISFVHLRAHLQTHSEVTVMHGAMPMESNLAAA